MINENSINELRNSLPKNKLADAFRVFYVTKDPIIRENLILKYMDKAREYFNKYSFIDIEEDDKNQMAYELLINAIDAYNPFKHGYFGSYLSRHFYTRIVGMNKTRLFIFDYLIKNNINVITKDNIDDILDYLINNYCKDNSIETIIKTKHNLGYNDDYSINDLEIESNMNVEEYVLNNVNREKMLEIIRYYASLYVGKDTLKVFNEYYDFDNNIIYDLEYISSKTGVDIKNVSLCINRVKRFINKKILEELKIEINKKSESNSSFLSINHFEDDNDDELLDLIEANSITDNSYKYTLKKGVLK